MAFEGNRICAQIAVTDFELHTGYAPSKAYIEHSLRNQLAQGIVGQKPFVVESMKDPMTMSTLFRAEAYVFTREELQQLLTNVSGIRFPDPQLYEFDMQDMLDELAPPQEPTETRPIFGL